MSMELKKLLDDTLTAHREALAARDLYTARCISASFPELLAKIADECDLGRVARSYMGEVANG